MSEWNPGIDGSELILPGKSTWEMLGLRYRHLSLTLVLLGVLAVGLLVTGEGYLATWWLTLVMAAILFESLIWIPVSILRENLRRRAEVKAGYTTVTNQHPEVPQVDPNSGRVVRLADEPLLDRAEYVRRIALIRDVMGGSR